jgi:ribonuclease HI
MARKSTPSCFVYHVILLTSISLPGHMKVNVDGSFHHDSHAGSIGAVIQNSNGDFVAASTVFLPHIMFRAAAEAMAMREGLSLVNRIGCTNVIMESDSTETIEACVLEILLKPLN